MGLIRTNKYRKWYKLRPFSGKLYYTEYTLRMFQIIAYIISLFLRKGNKMGHISRDEVLMGRDTEFPLTPELETNLIKLLEALNKIRDAYGKPLSVSSGYRPGHYNSDAGGAANSPHKSCEACDFHDPDRALTNWILFNKQILPQCGLYMESPDRTVGWVHLQVRVIPSGNRIFIP